MHVISGLFQNIRGIYLCWYEVIFAVLRQPEKALYQIKDAMPSEIFDYGWVSLFYDTRNIFFHDPLAKATSRDTTKIGGRVGVGEGVTYLS